MVHARPGAALAERFVWNVDRIPPPAAPDGGGGAVFSESMRASLLISAALACACSSPTYRAAVQTSTSEPPVAAPLIGTQEPVSSATDQAPAVAYDDYVNPGLTQLTVRVARISLGDNAWDPIEDQEGFGVEFSREPATQDIGWEIGLARYTDDERDAVGAVESELIELYVGARRTFGHAEAVWRPHFGGGLSFVSADVQNQVGDDDDDTSLAAYIHGGLSAFVTRHLTLGVDVRALFLSRLRLHGENLDADYLQLAFTAGWSF
jgi:hypothetical protein